MAHEIGHEILGARDAYESPFPNTPLTIMAEYGFATHIDPAHKLFSGHVLPEVVEIGSWATNDVQLAAIEKHHDLLVVYDNSRVDEFFLIENRWVDKSNHDELLDTRGRSAAAWSCGAWCATGRSRGGHTASTPRSPASTTPATSST